LILDGPIITINRIQARGHHAWEIDSNVYHIVMRVVSKNQLNIS